MPSAPPVSIVIPAYNAERFVTRAVKSALEQTLSGFEVLVIDDGSTDSTWEILEGFGDAIRRFRQPNGGPAKARNLGIQEARGRFVALLDADDEYLPTMLETQLSAWNAGNQPPLVFADMEIMGPSGAMGSYLRERYGMWGPGDGVSQFAFADVFRRNPIPLSTVLMPRELAISTGMFDATIPYGAEDWDLWLRMSQHGPLLGHTEIVGRRYEHDTNLSDDPKQMASRIAVVRKTRDSSRSLLDESGIRIDRVEARLLRESGYLDFVGGELGSARIKFRDSLRLYRNSSTLLYYAMTFLGNPMIRTLRGLKRSIQN